MFGKLWATLSLQEAMARINDVLSYPLDSEIRREVLEIKEKIENVLSNHLKNR